MGGDAVEMNFDPTTPMQVGVLFEPDDLDSLGEALQQLVSDVGDVAAMKRRAADACERYAWPAQEQTLLAAAGVEAPDVG